MNSFQKSMNWKRGKSKTMVPAKANNIQQENQAIRFAFTLLCN